MNSVLSFANWKKENHDRLVKQYARTRKKNRPEFGLWLQQQYFKETGQLA